jgi:hypothetical protein
MVIRDLKTLRTIAFAIEPVRGQGYRLVDRIAGKVAS